MKKHFPSGVPELCIMILLSVLTLMLIHNLKSPASGTWVEAEGKRYYRDTGGNPVTGWQTIENRQYYFAEDGSVSTGWLTLNGVWHYFLEDGSMATGWQTVGESSYHFTVDGTPLTGWQVIDGKNHYFHPDGTLAVGMTAIDGQDYLFSDDGILFTGFIQLDNKKYLFLPDGTMARGWAKYQEQWYYAMENGCLFTGWLQQGEYWYYLHPDGVMATGENIIDGKQYFFTPEGIQITLVNPWHSIPGDYRVDLVAVDDTYAMDRSCADALKQMLRDCAEAGHKGIICSGYRSQADQEWLYKRKVDYYLYEGLDEEKARELAGRSVAVPGTSEHQLGLAVDIVSTDYYVLDETQATTKVQQWLMEHCWEYGFILRYPVGTTDITGIVYEPWHYRYVGTAVSLKMKELGITLEEYLGAVHYE